MSDKPEKKGKSGGPNVVLLLVVVALVIIAIYKSRGDEEDIDGERTAAEADEQAETVKPVKLDDHLSGLGKVVAVGPAAERAKYTGTEVVGVDTIDGLAELLEGRDVDAVAKAIENAGIEHLMIDPGILKRNPIPKNTVKHRLALAHPSGRLSAVLMSKDLFLYRLRAPLELPIEAKLALTDIARSTFAGGDGAVPAGAPSMVTRDGDWILILTVRPVQHRHLSYHALAGKNLADMARRAGEKARKYYERKRYDRKFGPLPDALHSRITIELEVAYDRGTYVGPRDKEMMWRIIEPGIYGFRMNIDGRDHYLPGWYSVANNYREVNMLLERVVERYAKKSKDYWKRPDVAVHRFRTHHWREKAPGGEIEDLYRASPRVPEMKDVTREAMVEALGGLTDWIAYNQTEPSGRYVYRYFPTKDEENEEYNIVRHALGPFSMALGQEFAPDPIYKEKAEAGMKFMEDHIRWGGHPRKADGTIDTSVDSWMGKPLPGPDVAILDFPEPPKGDWSCKMGAVAVAILGYTQYKRVGWELGPEREKVLQGLANFLLYMQNERDGSFHHYYVAQENGYYGTRNSIYPGEILYAVARLYGETKDERYREVFKQSLKTNLEWFKGQMDQRLPDGTYEERHRKNLVQFQPWMAMAMDEMYRYDPDPSYVEASNLVSLWILDTYQFDETRAFYPDYLGGYFKVLDELPAMHTFVYTEGVAASFDLARRANVEPEILEKLRRGTFLSARFLMQQQSTPGRNDYYYPNPKKARGAVRYCINHNKQRIDYTYHALSAAYRIIRAATPEDYAMAQQLPMPGTW